MNDQLVPNPLASDPKFNIHKVFAAVGLILIASIIILDGVWWYVEGRNIAATVENTSTVKVTTTSAKPETTKDESKVSDKPKTSDEDENTWKTFTSTEFKYTFKYPGNYSLYKNDEFIEEELHQDVTIKPNKYSEDQVGTPSIKFMGNPTGDTCSERPDMGYKCIKESLLIGGKSATKITASNNLNYFDYIVDVDGENFVISANNIEGFEDLLDEILSTFKFL